MLAQGAFVLRLPHGSYAFVIPRVGWCVGRSDEIMHSIVQVDLDADGVDLGCPVGHMHWIKHLVDRSIELDPKVMIILWNVGHGMLSRYRPIRRYGGLPTDASTEFLQVGDGHYRVLSGLKEAVSRADFLLRTIKRMTLTGFKGDHWNIVV